MKLTHAIVSQAEQDIAKNSRLSSPHILLAAVRFLESEVKALRAALTSATQTNVGTAPAPAPEPAPAPAPVVVAEPAPAPVVVAPPPVVAAPAPVSADVNV